MPLRRSGVAIAALVVPVVAAVGVAIVVLAHGSDTPEPVALTSDGPSFATLDDLVAASDLVVVGTVVDIAPGRVLTASDRPDAGVRTRLIELAPERTLTGTPPEPLVVEEPVELLDGTPIVLDGMKPLAEGDQAIWFLVAGDGAESPYHAVVNAQGRYDVVGSTLRPRGADPLSAQLADLGLDGLIAALVDG